jgi:HAE1 family hydrophobic/amphiphilic exporter-1
VGDVAEVGEVVSPAAVSRVEGERAVTVTGEITSDDTQTVSTEAKKAIDDLELPGNVTAQAGGENEDIDESFKNLFLSIIVALVLVFLILVIFFGSLRVPLVILLAVPLTTVGAFGALFLTNTAISVPSLLGILLLIGIVVSNAILLVDFAIKAQEHYDTPDEALLEAGRARLRPILMTAFATIFALMPLAPRSLGRRERPDLVEPRHNRLRGAGDLDLPDAARRARRLLGAQARSQKEGLAKPLFVGTETSGLRRRTPSGG